MRPFVAGATGAIAPSRTAAATVAALDNGGPGVYNVVDDPAPVRGWVPWRVGLAKGLDE